MTFAIIIGILKFVTVAIGTIVSLLVINRLVVALNITTCWKANDKQHPVCKTPIYPAEFLSGPLAVPFEEKKTRKPRAKKVHAVTIDALNAGLSATDHLGGMYHQNLGDECETQYWKFPSGVGFRHATLDIPGGWKQCVLTPDGKKVLSVVQFNEVENE